MRYCSAILLLLLPLFATAQDIPWKFGDSSKSKVTGPYVFEKSDSGVIVAEKLTVVPEVITPQPFRQSIPYDPTHNCPYCGRSQYYISGRGPVPGSHTHTCSMGHTWFHYDR